MFLVEPVYKDTSEEWALFIRTMLDRVVYKTTPEMRTPH